MLGVTDSYACRSSFSIQSPANDFRTLYSSRKLFYHWEGEHPPTPDGSASKVQGFGTHEFDHAAGRLEAGSGGFLDVDPGHLSEAQWKTVLVKRVAHRSHISAMTRERMEARRALVKEILETW